MLHGIENTETVVDGTARGIDIKEYIFFRVFRLKKKQLRNHSIGGLSRDLFAKKNNAFAQ